MTATDQFTFSFDQSRCTGCKACQIACKDDNKLPVGTTWRRVYESSGGGWPEGGEILAPDGVFTYYTSMSCNHCGDPICVSVCPSTAMRRGEFGLVTVDAEICIGCGYCAMACPYQAPQYRSELGVMTKCDGCLDRIRAGAGPACVAACPTRALGFALGPAVVDPPAHIEPLPDPDITRPNLVLRAHPQALAAERERVTTSPRWEPRLSHEVPLAVFTVLAQAAAGLTVMAGLAMGTASVLGRSMGSFPLLVTLVAGALLGVALGASTSHLGSPLRAPNALRNWRASPLSREIIAAALFGLALMVLGTSLLFLPKELAWHAGLAALSGIAGVGLIVAIAKVYTLRTVPSWNSRFTTAAFLATAGAIGAGLCAWLTSLMRGDTALSVTMYLVSVAILALGRWTHRRHLATLAKGQGAAKVSLRILTVAHPRICAIGSLSSVAGAAVMVAAAIGSPISQPAAAVLGGAGVALVLTSELAGRLMFYRSMIREGR
ncbi:MAG: dimethyl sulfoxide reductase anchor subunit [Propionibacteriaceae bacterium]|nr:dimethyl sulfoxide reductase anchor subunit [Propionibacteriaceae bacterium]